MKTIQRVVFMAFVGLLLTAQQGQCQIPSMENPKCGTGYLNCGKYNCCKPGKCKADGSCAL